MAKSSIVGELINFRGLVYGPVNEMGVVALFAKVGEELGFIIEEIRAEFPDCIARRQGGDCKLVIVNCKLQIVGWALLAGSREFSRGTAPGLFGSQRFFGLGSVSGCCR